MVYDNDVMAAAGLAVAAEEGVPVPEQLSVVAWDGSPLSRLASPPLSVVASDVHALGAPAGERVLAAVAPAATLHAQPPRLTLRGTTAAHLSRHTSGVS